MQIQLFAISYKPFVHPNGRMIESAYTNRQKDNKHLHTPPTDAQPKDHQHCPQ